MKNRNDLKKLSFKELVKETAVLGKVLKHAFKFIEDEFHRNTLIVSVYESLLTSATTAQLTKGELKTSFDTLTSIKGVSPYQDFLIELDTPDFSEFSEAEESNSFIAVLAFKHGAEDLYPTKPYKNPSKPTRRELERRRLAYHNQIDFMVDQFSRTLSLKVAHYELIESAIEQYLSGDRTLLELKGWRNKFHNKNVKGMSQKELSEHLEMPNLQAQKDQVDNLLFLNTQKLLNEWYSEELKTA